MRGGSGGHGDGGGAGANAEAEAAEGEEGRRREAAREREIFRLGWVGLGRTSELGRQLEGWKSGKQRRGGTEWAAPRGDGEDCGFFAGFWVAWQSCRPVFWSGLASWLGL